MKDLKEIILEKRVREFKVDGKKVPDKYIAVFNDYLKQIAEKLKIHDRELVKEVCEKIEDWCNKNFNWVGDGTGYDGQDYNEMIGSNDTINKLRGFLSQIQKEFEDGK